MRVIHFSVLRRKNGKRVTCWLRLLLFSLLAGLVFGGVFEYLRLLVDGVWSIGSSLREMALMGFGCGAILLVDGLLKPLERLFPVEEDVNDKDDDLEPVKTQVIPRLKIDED